MAKLKVSLDNEVTICDCCGKHNLKRTLKIKTKDDGTIHLGVTCAGNRFDLNLSGNPYKAAERLEFHIQNLNKEEFKDIIENISSDAVMW